MSLAVDVRATFTADGTEPFTVDVALDVRPGETLVVLGPSGSGKSLLLETVAGFHAHEGTVTHDGSDLTGTEPEARGFGFVFQDYALFPHLTVRENVAFGARYHEDTRDPDELLAELGVGQLADRTPKTLSGGEKQRVALARSLAIRPAALLLDEPLSALDVPTRQTLRTDLARIVADVTAVYVTHDRTTARALADRIAVMRDGELVQVDTPEEVFESPASPFVARFTGSNVVAGDALDALASVDGLGGDWGQFAIRPEHVVVGDAADTTNTTDTTDTTDITDTTDTEATVERVVREDAAFRVTLALGSGGDEATVDAFVSTPPAVGETVGLRFPPEHVTRFRDE